MLFAPVLCLACYLPIQAQWLQPHSPQMPAPPPMKFVSRDEQTQLDGASDPKSHTRLSIDLASEHLSQAEQFTAQKKYEAASEELGRYMGLINYTLRFLGRMNSDKGKTRDLYRFVDIALRAHLPRLAVMRRATPVEYGINLKDAEDYVRNARSDALDSFYGNTVVKEPEKKTEKATKDPTLGQDTKHP